MHKRNTRALSIFAIFYISFGIFITVYQEKVIYHPNEQSFENCPALVSAKKITHQDTRMYVSNTDRPTIVLYHGNAGSACDRDLYTNIFTQADHGYILVEYAGYSNDSRTPSHDLMKQDVKNVISYLEQENISDVTVVGESIGTGAASYHTSLSVPKKLILISPFTNLKDIAKDRFWFYPTKLLVDNAFDNREALQEYTGKTLIIHGNEDDVIPYELGNKLFESISSKKDFITIEGAGHNNLFTHQETYAAIHDFLTKQ